MPYQIGLTQIDSQSKSIYTVFVPLYQTETPSNRLQIILGSTDIVSLSSLLVVPLKPNSPNNSARSEEEVETISPRSLVAGGGGATSCRRLLFVSYTSRARGDLQGNIQPQ